MYFPLDLENESDAAVSVLDKVAGEHIRAVKAVGQHRVNVLTAAVEIQLDLPCQTVHLLCHSIIFAEQQHCRLPMIQPLSPCRLCQMCSSMDILPTMFNLMGADYDSRLIIGRDILSDSTGLVLFPDRSFITDAFEYNAVTDTLTSHTGAEISDDSFSAMQLYVADKFTAADNITESGYYTYVARYLGIDEDN